MLAGIAVALTALAVVVIAAPSGAQAVNRSAPSEQEIGHAIDQLKADPNLATERKTRILKWKEKDDQPPERTRGMPGWLRWLGEFFSWLGATARVLVWLVAGLLAAILIVWIIRFMRGMESGSAMPNVMAPTHVRDLDIRPESLPHDIGQAALKLWENGEHRAALSLLYRGLLSRLAHQYAVPIRHSSTEGECRTLALQSLPSHCHSYVSLLIRTWQLAVYGGTDPNRESVQYLCANFAILDRVTTEPGAGPAAASVAS